MIRSRGFFLGALTFLAAHAVLLAGWRTWFEPGGAHAAWFLNSGRGVAFTIGCLLVGSAVAAAIGPPAPRDRVLTGTAFGAGALVAMAGVLFSGGAGTIFPIVLAVAAVIAVTSGVAGALAGGALRATLSRR
jgi:hypothetical protein